MKEKITTMFLATVNPWNSGTVKRSPTEVLNTYEVAGRTLCVHAGRDNSPKEKYRVSDYETGLFICYSPSKELKADQLEDLHKKFEDAYRGDYTKLYESNPVINGPHFEEGYQKAKDFLAQIPVEQSAGVAWAVTELETYKFDR